MNKCRLWYSDNSHGYMIYLAGKVKILEYGEMFLGWGEGCCFKANIGNWLACLLSHLFPWRLTSLRGMFCFVTFYDAVIEILTSGSRRSISTIRVRNLAANRPIAIRTCRIYFNIQTMLHFYFMCIARFISLYICMHIFLMALLWRRITKCHGKTAHRSLNH